MEKQSYRLDRTRLTSLTFNEADGHVNYWQEKTEDERLNAAYFYHQPDFRRYPTNKSRS